MTIFKDAGILEGLFVLLVVHQDNRQDDLHTRLSGRRGVHRLNMSMASVPRHIVLQAHRAGLLTRTNSALTEPPSGLVKISNILSPRTMRLSSRVPRTLPIQFGKVAPSTRLPVKRPLWSTV